MADEDAYEVELSASSLLAAVEARRRDKPHECRARYCSRYFVTVGNRNRHERAKHGASPPICRPPAAPAPLEVAQAPAVDADGPNGDDRVEEVDDDEEDDATMGVNDEGADDVDSLPDMGGDDFGLADSSDDDNNFGLTGLDSDDGDFGLAGLGDDSDDFDLAGLGDDDDEPLQVDDTYEPESELDDDAVNNLKYPLGTRRSGEPLRGAMAQEDGTRGAASSRTRAGARWPRTLWRSSSLTTTCRSMTKLFVMVSPAAVTAASRYPCTCTRATAPSAHGQVQLARKALPKPLPRCAVDVQSQWYICVT